MRLILLVAAVLAGCSASQARREAATYTPPAFVIRGDRDFEGRVRQAVMMLSLADPEGLAVVEGHVGVIRQFDPSGMGAFENPPRMDLGMVTVNASLTWLASVLVHEAHHSRMYAQAKGTAPDAEPEYDAWAGFDAERACNEVQMQSLLRLAAPLREVEHLAAQDGRHGDMNGDGKLDWEDYRLRNW